MCTHKMHIDPYSICNVHSAIWPKHSNIHLNLTDDERKKKKQIEVLELLCAWTFS